MAALPPEVAKLITKIKVFKGGITKQAKENKAVGDVFKLTLALEHNLAKEKYTEKDVAELDKILSEMKKAKAKLPSESQKQHVDFFSSVERFNANQLKGKK